MSEKQKKKVGPHLTRQQKTKLLSLIQENPLLRSGKFNANFTLKDSALAWQRIATELNAMPGAHKEWQAWRKTWQDIYSKIKGKQADINRSRRETGGGTPPPPLTPFEEGVSNLINPKVVSGHDGSEESAVVFNFETENVPDDAYVVYQIIDSEQQGPSAEQTAGPSAQPSAGLGPSADPVTNSTKPKQKKINIKSLLKEKLEIIKQYNKEKLDVLREKNQKLENINNSILMLAKCFEKCFERKKHLNRLNL